jgi:hypothetical protein
MELFFWLMLGLFMIASVSTMIGFIFFVFWGIYKAIRSGRRNDHVG